MSHSDEATRYKNNLRLYVVKEYPSLARGRPTEMFTPTELTLLITTLGLLIIAYFKWSFNYWKRRGLPQLTPKIPFGNSESPFNARKGLCFKVKEFYDEFKAKGLKHGGIYSMTSPIYLPVDPEYIKNILAKNFQHFVDRGMFYNEKDDPLSAHLFNIEGQKWRRLRTKFTPTFTSGKMKMMFQVLVECAEQMMEKIEKTGSQKEALDVKETVACFTTDVIGSCAFGLECNSFKDPDAEFRKYGRKVFVPSKYQAIRTLATISAPNLCKFFRMSRIPKEVNHFFMNVVKDMVEYRENNNFTRNDFAQLLVELRAKKIDSTQEDGLTLEEIAAQAFAFFLAGFETSSTTLTFCFYELAKNQDIQDKVRSEIQETLAKAGEKITYENIMGMKYMGQVIEETLRKYPAIHILNRICTEACNVPDTNVHLEKGTKVLISVFGVHHDPEYYPEPEKFDPERFTEENKAKRPNFTFLPFGEGPRNCIGLRFGLMQTRIGMTHMLRNYRYTLNSKTPRELGLAPKSSILLASLEKVLLDVEKIVPEVSL